MNNLDLESSALQWLLYKKKCIITSMERGLYDFYKPDVLGVTKKRELIEIEIKRSFQDFKANFKKDFFKIAKKEHLPHYFYFLVTPDIANQCLEYYNPIHECYGILTVNKVGIIYSVKKVEKNKLRKKLTLLQLTKLVRSQSKTIYSLWEVNRRIGTNEKKEI
jgi:hypothetical protein